MGSVKSETEMWRYRPGTRVVGTHYSPPRQGTIKDFPNADRRVGVMWDNDEPKCPDIVHVMHLEIATTQK